MKSICILALLLFIAASVVVVLAQSGNQCMLYFQNNLVKDTIHLCGRQNGGIPGAFFDIALAPNSSATRPCLVTQQGQSFETYFTIRNGSKSNHTGCGWDQGCEPNTGTCHTYPYSMGQGLSSQDGYWYGSLNQNYDGQIGYTRSSFGNPNLVDYQITLNCMSYGTTPYNSTCGNTQGFGLARVFCKPNHPNYDKFASTGVVACGPKDGASVYITISENS